MTWNGNGTFDPPSGPEFPANAGDTIRADYFNSVIRALCAGFSNTLPRNGEATATAPMVFQEGSTLTASPANTDASTKIATMANVQSRQADLGFTPIQQGGGVGQSTNKLYIGWGNSTGGIKFTVDGTDMGYAALSYTNPIGGNTSFNGPLVCLSTIYAQSSTNLKIALCDGGTVRGFVSAGANMTFGVTNAANTLYTFTVDNSGSGLFAGTAQINGDFIRIGSANYAYYRADGQLALNSTNFSPILTQGNLTNTIGFAPLGSGVNGFAPGGLVEVGRYIDMHSGNSSNDWDVRLDCQNSTGGTGTSVLNISCTGISTNGYLTAGAISGTTITQTSDKRLKMNKRKAPTNMIERFAKMWRGLFDWKVSGVTSIGIMAQDLRKFMPWVIHTNSEGVVQVDSGSAALFMIGELSERLLKAEARIVMLEKLL